MAYQINLVPVSDTAQAGQETSFDVYLTNTEGTGVTSLEMALFVNQPLLSEYPVEDWEREYFLQSTFYVNNLMI